jgi:hypothetical protein
VTLGLILLVGGCVMIAATFVEEIFSFAVRYLPSLVSTHFEYARVEWHVGSTLQLQRLAHENLGLGSWSRTDEAIPVTRLGETLAVIDFSDPKRARMILPSGNVDHVELQDRGKAANCRVRYLRVPSNEQL